MPNGRLNGWWPKIIAALVGVTGTAVVSFGVVAIKERAEVISQVRQNKEDLAVNSQIIREDRETARAMLIKLDAIRDAVISLETTMSLKIKESERIHDGFERRIDRMEARRP